MQLVRNLYTDDAATAASYKRKIREAKLAEELENKHPGTGKIWILDNYLNNVPYGTVGGQTAIGVQAAARMFFDKPAQRRSTLDQSALLAGLPQAPSLYNPFLDPQRAKRAPQRGAAAMVERGYISQREADAGDAARPLGVSTARYYTAASRAALLRLRPAASSSSATA